MTIKVTEYKEITAKDAITGVDVARDILAEAGVIIDRYDTCIMSVDEYNHWEKWFDVYNKMQAWVGECAENCDDFDYKYLKDALERYWIGIDICYDDIDAFDEQRDDLMRFVIEEMGW